ncbi:response regulator transcription factor [Altericroceibacterium endophyticum]|uniref:Response regulator n=1 Tax=Altericroceibacterium endophyticum TaxID=1808508 RepID=A0A6I4T8D4_9SPHN|nr:response regulator [Altericroceibacterium endophyticum]MXO66381.1 response regulator [Altericroceibacterium endophyticum]
MARILYAEDDEIVGEIVSDALMDAGHAVGWLKDGDSALEAIKARTPDLVILDYEMPGLSGVQVLRAMRSDSDLAMIPVLMLTAHSGDADQNIAFYEGADDYITKPFKPRELIDRAEWLIDGNIKRAKPKP